MRALPFDTGVKSDGTAARPAAPPSAPAAASARLTLFTSLEEAEPFWTAFEKEAALHVFQTYAWAKTFQETVGKAEGLRPLIIAVETPRGAPLMLFPLALDEKGALTKLIWLGGDTADYHAPLLAPDWRAALAPQSFNALWKEIRAALPAHDLIDLGKQPADIQGTDNPFMALGLDLHPAGTHMTKLGEDWESYYKSKRSSSTRKRDRNRGNQSRQQSDQRQKLLGPIQCDPQLRAALLRGFQALVGGQPGLQPISEMRHWRGLAGNHQPISDPAAELHQAGSGQVLQRNQNAWRQTGKPATAVRLQCNQLGQLEA